MGERGAGRSARCCASLNWGSLTRRAPRRSTHDSSMTRPLAPRPRRLLPDPRGVLLAASIGIGSARSRHGWGSAAARRPRSMPPVSGPRGRAGRLLVRGNKHSRATDETDHHHDGKTDVFFPTALHTSPRAHRCLPCWKHWSGHGSSRPSSTALTKGEQLTARRVRPGWLAHAAGKQQEGGASSQQPAPAAALGR